MTTSRWLSFGFGAARAAFGVFGTAAPGRLGRSWIGPAAEGDQAQVILRALGIRDVAIGGGTMAAALAGPATGWLLASAMADLGDAASTLFEAGHLPDRGVKVTLALAGGSAVAGLALAAVEARSEP